RTAQSIPPGLERLILKCLSKDPNKRPQSASEMSQALSWVPTDAWGETQASEWWNQHRLPNFQSIANPQSALEAV
ncbi:MAG TPA: hypothetical protein VIG78_03780, partial [Gemmatimonadaceae bacterium]